MRWGELTVAGALLAASAPVAAQASVSLPIARGFWTNEGQKCGTAHYGYVFDGKRWGSLYYYGPTQSLGPNAELQPITQTRAVAGGFTQMQFGGFDGAGYFRMKSLGPAKAHYRVGAPFRDQLQVSDETLTLCPFQTLSPKMKAAIQRFAPTLVPVR